MSWKCPYCDQVATLIDANLSVEHHRFNNDNKDGDLFLASSVIVCPNTDCKEYTIEAHLYKAVYEYGSWQIEGKPKQIWKLKPLSSAQVFPDYIPKPIRDDYEEACFILTLSPKASATLSRRCLQGMIRDFWKISKTRLIDEIAELEDKIDPETWAAIDAVRKIGNIGAHMEKDINVIVDVDPNEAELLKGLIETLIEEWYVRRHKRNEKMKSIIAVAESKKEKKTQPASSAIS